MRIAAVFILFLAVFCVHASDEQKTICLNMIVKNESPVIERCLASVKGLIDYWVIVDTGSSDGTQEIIRRSMKGIPGELHERPWVDFGYNRTEAINLAKNKADYLMFIDADEFLEVEKPINKASLNGDGYLVSVRISDDVDICLQRAFLVSTKLDWLWKNVLHERLVTSQGNEVLCPLNGICISAISTDGNRSQDPQKYLKDAKLLEKALEKEPDNADYVYYLAQSYFNIGKYDLALKNYEKRAGMQGWDQATFWSQYYTGVLQEQLGYPSDIFIRSYHKAFVLRPSRTEPLFRLADYFFRSDNFVIAYLLASMARQIPVPDDLIYIEYWVYHYALPFVYANAAFLMGKQEEAQTCYQELLKRKDLPKEYREQVTKNLELLQRMKS